MGAAFAASKSLAILAPRAGPVGRRRSLPLGAFAGIGPKTDEIVT